MSAHSKTVLLLYADKYYLLNQVFPVGLNLISRHLRRRGHRAVMAHPFLPDRDYKRNIRDAIRHTEPDCVGIGIRNLDTCMSCEQHGDFEGRDYRTFYFLPQIKEVVSEIRNTIPKVPLVAGGGAFTMSPVAILTYLGLDYGIVGEGEEPFCRFIEAFPDKNKIRQIPNMVYRFHDGYKVNRRQPYSFETDPALEDRDDGFDFALQATGVPVQVKRGCHHRCSYCVEPLIEGRRFVFRPIDSVINELKTMADTLEAADRVFFVDTEFNVPDLRYGAALIRALLREGLHERFRFVTQLIPKPFDAQFAALLAEAHFSVIFSCESFSNAVLGNNYVSYGEKEIMSAIEASEGAGLHCTVSLIFGLPGEDYKTMDHTLSRMKQYPMGPLRDYEYTVGGRIYQGTPLCEYVERNNPSGDLYGRRSRGYLSPYYFCSPASPFDVHEYLREVFPETLCYHKRYDEGDFEEVAIGYLSDHRLWGDAGERFKRSDVRVQSGIYDYFFKKLLHAGRQEDARSISRTMLENMEGAGDAIDPRQADVVKFYLSHL
ncbi:MAG: cobalamin-dependent protein [Thermodesulfobacteriota bacterium]|nr:cobalamin-dependent protein [Thermodesulfobacteriota bacterium]